MASRGPRCPHAAVAFTAASADVPRRARAHTGETPVGRPVPVTRGGRAAGGGRDRPRAHAGGGGAAAAGLQLAVQRRGAAPAVRRLRAGLRRPAGCRAGRRAPPALLGAPGGVLHRPRPCGAQPGRGRGRAPLAGGPAQPSPAGAPRADSPLRGAGGPHFTPPAAPLGDSSPCLPHRPLRAPPAARASPPRFCACAACMPIAPRCIRHRTGP